MTAHLAEQVRQQQETLAEGEMTPPHTHTHTYTLYLMITDRGSVNILTHLCV